MNKFKIIKIQINQKIKKFVEKSEIKIQKLKFDEKKLKSKIEDLKIKKTWCNYKLKHFYLNFLLNFAELKEYDKNILYIIKKMRIQKENILYSNFNNFFNKKDFNFCLNYSEKLRKFNIFKKISRNKNDYRIQFNCDDKIKFLISSEDSNFKKYKKISSKNNF